MSLADKLQELEYENGILPGKILEHCGERWEIVSVEPHPWGREYAMIRLRRRGTKETTIKTITWTP